MKGYLVTCGVPSLEELTLEELIRYTVRIEQDSFLFYRRAARNLEGSELRPFADELADFKVSQLKQLKELLGEFILDTLGSGDMIDVDTTLFDEILKNGEIPAQATPRDVLLFSLRREDNTRRTFEMILSLPIIDERAQQLFSALRDDEERRIRVLKERIGRVQPHN
jgi:rubrerythrin